MWRSACPRRRGALALRLYCPFALPLCHKGQHLAQSLVLDNRGLVDFLQPVKGPVGQVDAPMANGQPSIRIIDHRDTLAGEGPCDLARLEKKHHLFVLERQVAGDRPHLLPGKGLVQVVVWRQRPVQIPVVKGSLRLMLTVLGGLAEFERSLIKERTSEGGARAVRAGKKLGRRPLLTGVQQAEALRLAGEGKSHAEIGLVLRVSRSTITRFPAKPRRTLEFIELR